MLGQLERPWEGGLGTLRAYDSAHSFRRCRLDSRRLHACLPLSMCKNRPYVAEASEVSFNYSNVEAGDQSELGTVS